MKTPRFWQTRNWLSTILLPVAWMYQLGASMRAACAQPLSPDIPVICVGNAVAGGAGKTPTVLYMAKLCAERNVSKAILMRGYKSRNIKPMQINTGNNTHIDVGDESLLLSKEAPTWIARRRRDGYLTIRRDFPEAACVIMDDGLQNPTLQKTASILVVDGGYGIGNGRCLPAGPLREPWESALRKADAVLIIGDDRQHMAARCGAVPVLRGWLQPATEGLSLAQGRWLAFAGIGRPAKFFETLTEAGAQLVATRPFADHHLYKIHELESLAAQAAQLQARLITTEKDAVRLSPAWRERIAVLPVTLLLDEASVPWLEQRLAMWLIPQSSHLAGFH